MRKRFFLLFVYSLTAVCGFALNEPCEKGTVGGTCGDNITWSFDFCTETLIIDGTGEMWDYCQGLWPSTTLKYVIIKNGVTSIGLEAFAPLRVFSPDIANFFNLTSVTIPNSVTHIGDGAFRGCTGLTSIAIPNSVTSIGADIFAGCTSLTSITIPNSVTRIEFGAFWGCTGLTSITIPNSVTHIESAAFWGCTGLTSIPITNSVTYIGDGFLSGCTGLTSITIPNSVTHIGSMFFWGCTGLTSVSIPENVTNIGEYAFCECSNLTSITIPSSVTNIEIYAFALCSLSSIYCHAVEPPQIRDDTFSDYTAILHVPKGSVAKYKNHRIWRNFNIEEEVDILQLTKEYHYGYYTKPSYIFADYGYGYTKNVKGVTADGQAAIKIMTDYTVDYWTSKDEVDIASSEIQMSINGNNSNSDCTGTHSELQRDAYGYYYFVYQAPADFPQDIVDSEYTVNINVSLKDKNGKKLAVGQTDISVIRPPLLLVHGLNDDASCFTRLNMRILAQQVYKPFQIQRVDYSDTNKQHFRNNINALVGELDGADGVFMRCLRAGYVSAKVDIVGHSMGGILSRLYAQEISKEDVNRIITLNTPHSGSQGANLIMNEPIIKAAIGNHYNNQFDAISDLQVNNPAIDNLLNGEGLRRADGIPVHSICTVVSSLERDDIPVSDDIIWGASKLFGYIAPRYKTISVEEGIISALNSLLMDLYEGSNDCVVALNSQTGGLSNNHTSVFLGNFKEKWHSVSPNDSIVCDRIINLLRKPTTDAAFARSFSPLKLNYKFNFTSSTSTPLRMTKSKESYIVPHAIAHLDELKKTVEVILNASADIKQKAVYGFFDSDRMFVESGDNVTIYIPDKYEGELKIYAIGCTSQDEYVTDSTSVHFDNSHLTPLYIYFEDNDTLYVEIGRTIKRTVICGWNDNTESIIAPKFISDSDNISIDSNYITGETVGRCRLTAQFGSLSASIPVSVVDSTRFSGVLSIPHINQKKMLATATCYYDSQTRSLTVMFQKEYVGSCNLDVFNISGEKMYAHREKKINAQSNETMKYILPLSGTGVYIVRLMLDSEIIRQKILIK